MQSIELDPLEIVQYFMEHAITLKCEDVFDNLDRVPYHKGESERETFKFLFWIDMMTDEKLHEIEKIGESPGTYVIVFDPFPSMEDTPVVISVLRLKSAFYDHMLSICDDDDDRLVEYLVQVSDFKVSQGLTELVSIMMKDKYGCDVHYVTQDELEEMKNYSEIQAQPQEGGEQDKNEGMGSSRVGFHKPTIKDA